MAKSFTAQLQAFVDKTERKMTAVLRQSVEDVFRIAQTTVAQGGSMPVLNSDLRNSLATEINGASVAEGPDSYTLAVAQLEPGDHLRGAWTEEYAIVRHYKPEDFGQGGGMWRDKAAAQWQGIVDANARKVQS